MMKDVYDHMSDGKTSKSTSTNRSSHRFQRPGGPENVDLSSSESLQPPNLSKKIISKTKTSYDRRARYLTADDDNSYESDDSDSMDLPGVTHIPGPAAFGMPRHTRAPPPAAATASNSVTDPTLTTIEAQVVNPDVEENRVRQEVLEEIHAKAPTATIVDVNNSDNNNNIDSSTEKRRLVMAVSALCLIVVVAVVVTITLLSLNDNDGETDSAGINNPSGNAAAAPQSPIPSMMPTAIPTISPSPTGSPTSTPTSMPSSFWTQVGESFLLRESIEGLSREDTFGISTALSRDGQNVAVGSFRYDVGDDLSSAGLVQVFRYETGSQTYKQVGQNLVGGTSDGRFGTAVALSSDGTILACGEIGSDSNGLDEAGRVTVYRLLSGQRWVPLGSSIDGLAQNDEYGYSVSLSGNGMVLAIGTGTGEGLVYKFNTNNDDENEWQRIGGAEHTFSFADNADQSNINWMFLDLSEDGTILAEGSHGSGRIRVHNFLEQDNRWEQIGGDIIVHRSDNFASSVFDYPDCVDSFGRLGTSLSLSGDGAIVAIGAITADKVGGRTIFDTGLVEVFRYDDVENSWIQFGQSLWGSGHQDFFGISVSLSDNGRRMAVGASQQFALDHIANCGDTCPPGYAIAYGLSNDNSTWTQLGDIQVGFAEDDDFGHSVSLSGDGTVLSIGAPQFRAGPNVAHSGYVRILRGAET